LDNNTGVTALLYGELHVDLEDLSLKLNEKLKDEPIFLCLEDVVNLLKNLRVELDLPKNLIFLKALFFLKNQRLSNFNLLSERTIPDLLCIKSKVLDFLIPELKGQNPAVLISLEFNLAFRYEKNLSNGSLFSEVKRQNVIPAKSTLLEL
jgi:hypothetical protein